MSDLNGSFGKPEGLVGTLGTGKSLNGYLGAVGSLTGELGGSLIPGPQGPKGEKGDKGDKGDRGDKGETGPQGPKGEKGDKGDKGDRGDKGDKGDRGDKGETGAQGPRGETGPKGDKGDPGEQGETGSTGPMGPQGDRGPKGDTGDTGPQGLKGDKGDKGDPGDDYILTQQDKEDIAGLVDDKLVVTIGSAISETAYRIDSTFLDILDALSRGVHVVIKDANAVYPYVGISQIDNEVVVAFGISITYENISVLIGYIILQSNIAAKVNQQAIIPTKTSQLTNDSLVGDVQINGSSVASGGVANIPVANGNTIGVVKGGNGGTGVIVGNGGTIYVVKATSSEIKGALDEYRPIVPLRQHESAFYGLAKAAGDTTMSNSGNAVGTYTPEALVAIQKMLGVYQAPFRTIKKIAITEETKTVYVNSDSNNEPFSLSEVVIFVKAIATNNGAGFFVINHGNVKLTSEELITNPFANADYIFYTTERAHVIHMWISGNRFFGETMNNTGNGYTRVNKQATRQSMGFCECNAITELFIYSPNDYKFTSGTITIIGR